VLVIDIITTEGAFAVFVGTDIRGSLTSFFVCFHSGIGSRDKLEFVVTNCV